MARWSILKQVDAFNGLTDEQLEKVAFRCQEMLLAQGDIILYESDQSDEVYVVAEGEVEISIRTSDTARSGTAEISIIRLGAGQIFGEMALIDQGLRSATVRCVTTPTRLLVIPHEDFVALCKEDGRLGFIVMRNVAADLCFKLRSHNLAWK